MSIEHRQQDNEQTQQSIDKHRTNQTEVIRQGVHDRHWQLFETRLKKSRLEIDKENYTTANNYRIINR
jgi:hypothetical protein